LAQEFSATKQEIKQASSTSFHSEFEFKGTQVEIASLIRADKFKTRLQKYVNGRMLP